MNANSARGQDETFKERTYGTGRRILVPPSVSTRNHIKGERLCVQGHCLLRWHAEKVILEAHLVLLSAQLGISKKFCG